MHQGEQRKGGVPQPAMAVVPISLATQALREGSGGSRDDSACRDVGLFVRLLSRCNDVGLLPEEIDPSTGRMLGNFPQAYSHVGLINCALNLSRQTGPAEKRAEPQAPPIVTPAVESAVSAPSFDGPSMFKRLRERDGSTVKST
jgi:hypothetical protein